MKKCFSNILSKIDIFGIRTEFQINKQSKFRTNSGGIFTLIYVASFVLLLILLSSDMINHTNPNIGLSQLYTPNPAKTNISKNNYFFMLGLQDSNSNHFIDDEIYNITCHNGKKNITGIKKFPIPLEPCSIQHLPDDKELQDYFINLVGGLDYLPQIYCIKEGFMNLDLKGEWDQNDYDYLQIKIYPCVNSSTKTCKSKEIVQSQLKQGFFGYYSTDYFFDLMNYEKPAQKIGRDYFIPTSYQIKKTIYRYLRTDKIQNDDGWLISNTNEKEYYAYDNDIESFTLLDNTKDGQQFVEMQVRKQYYQRIYSRTYKSIKTISSEIVGFLNLILFILTLIAKPFTRKEYYDTLANNIYNFELDQSHEKKELLSTKSKALKTMIDSQTYSPEKKQHATELFNSIVKSRDTPIKISLWETIKTFVLKKPEVETKKKQKDKGVRTIFSQLDINYVLKKFMELDKLKMLLLDENQCLLFEYLPKPIILKSLKIDLNYVGKSNFHKKPDIRNEDDLVIHAKSLKKAFNHICNKSEMSEIDLKLMTMLDDDITEFMKKDRKFGSLIQMQLDTIKEKFTTGSPKTERKESVVSFPTNKSNI